jgi:hypothetical protein
MRECRGGHNASRTKGQKTGESLEDRLKLLAMQMTGPLVLQTLRFDNVAVPMTPTELREPQSHPLRILHVGRGGDATFPTACTQQWRSASNFMTNS